MMHPPCQISRPLWLAQHDNDSVALNAREAFLTRYPDQPVIIFGTHFANPVGSKTVKDGNTYRLAV